ncbi:MAG: hypothetical protein ACI9H1_001914, partial [Polaribacter sp.]
PALALLLGSVIFKSNFIMDKYTIILQGVFSPYYTDFTRL